MSLCGKIILKTPSLYCLHLTLAVFFCFLTNVSSAQIRSVSDSTNIVSIDSVKKDSVINEVNTAKSLEDSLGIKISKDALPAPVISEAVDSAVLDLKKNLFYLYGEAKIKHEDMQLDADLIKYDQEVNTITASPIYDSLGIPGKKPTFKQGAETVTFDSLQYNFKSRRAIIRNARSQYGEGFVFSNQVKRNPDQSIYGWKNVYTTCALDTPHFGIRAQRIKVIPEKVIASASANFMVEQVPTPLFLPFGLFPISQRQRSGFQLPTYTFEQNRGLGLTNGGYYFHFSDYIDLLFLANIYTKGSWSGSGISNYSNRYKYNGGLSVSYAYNKTGETYEPGASITKDFMVNWRHQTDAKSRPGVSFNAAVTVGTSSFYSNNSYNINQILNNQFTSNISYSKNWIGKPFSLSVAARHNQNTQTRLVDVYLPEMNFYMSQFNPFENKKRIGAPKWYEKITTSYNLNAVNQTSFYDTTFSLNTLGDYNYRNGIKHTVPISAAYNVLRFINLSFGTTYTEYWLTNRRYRFYNDIEGRLDTIENKGFFTARDLSSVTMSLSSRVYGLKMFRKGKLMGIRHVLTPNVGFSYTPDYAASPFNYYYQTRLDTSSSLSFLSPFESSIIGTPGQGQFGNFASTINFGINNNLQIKTRSKKDTTGTGRNITLIDGFSINSGYNIAADSFNWSPFNMAFRTNIVDKVNISANALFNPYDIDLSTNTRSKKTMWQERTGLARFERANISLGANFQSKQKEKKQPTVNTEEYEMLMRNGGYYNYLDFDIPWSFNVSYSLGINKEFLTSRKKDTITLNQFLQFSGDFNLTSRWKISYSSGYDFYAKSLTVMELNIYRDLHCWEMRLGTIPFGPRKSYNFTLNVKAAVLQDLKLIRRRDFRDVVQ